MRQLALIITGLLVISIILAGCGQKVVQESSTIPADTAKVTANATVSEPVPPAEAKPTATSVTKSDLDQLKNDLNDMQFDDLNAIS